MQLAIKKALRSDKPEYSFTYCCEDDIREGRKLYIVGHYDILSDSLVDVKTHFDVFVNEPPLNIKLEVYEFIKDTIKKFHNGIKEEKCKT